MASEISHLYCRFLTHRVDYYWTDDLDLLLDLDFETTPRLGFSISGFLMIKKIFMLK